MSKRLLGSVGMAVVLAGATLALGFPHARAGERLRVKVLTLKLPGRVVDYDVRDMDGDGRPDLVVSHLKGDPDERDERGAPWRYVSLFRQQVGPQRFREVPDVTRAVPSDAVAFAAGDFDPAPGGEVALLTTSGVELLRGGPAGPLSQNARVLSAPLFFDTPSIDQLPRWDLTPDLDGDGRRELVVPLRDGYQLLRNDAAKGLVVSGKVPAVPTDRYGPSLETKFLNRFLTFFSSMPRVVAIDLNADGRKDLVVYRKKGLARFLQRADGTFPDKPDDERTLRIVEEGRTRSRAKAKDGIGGGGGGGGEAFENVRLALADLDRDGYADLVATKTLGEIGVFESLRTQFLIFRGGPKGFDEERPSKILNQRGVSMDPVLIDWNGDGDLDLITSSFRMDHFTNLRRAITKSMTITYAIYIFRGGEETFADEPDFTRDVEVELEALERRGGAQHATFEADLNGDKYRDMVVKAARGKLEIVPGGTESSFFSGKRLAFKEDEAVTVDVPPNCDVEARAFGSDGRDALVILNPAADDPERSRMRIIEVAE